MSYTKNSKIPSEIANKEIELLKAGFSYSEIASITGNRIKSISERNRLVYQIDIWEAFEKRIGRVGIPNRLSITNEFGYWFSGFFDGEGTITVYTRNREKYAEFRLSLRIMLRDDDADVINRIYDNLQIGRIYRNGKRGNTNPTKAWTVENINDLAEIMIPLFEKYPLYSKKAKEFIVWKDLVINRYVSTLGGYSNRSPMSNEDRRAFDNAIELINQIRTY